jgi:hypothetical protein
MIRNAKAWAGIVLLLVVFTVSFIQDKRTLPNQYVFEKLIADNSVQLYTIRTSPDNVRLQAIDTNVTDTIYVGLNGGFFWEGALLSIAVINDQPLKGARGDYGSGWYNTGVDMNTSRGTLVWDEVAHRFSIQVATQADELSTTDKRHYWAQGGVSMGLSDEAGWQRQMIAEEMPSYDEGHMRTGLVYDRNEQLYMIVTPSHCTIEQFRSAIVDKLGPRGIVDGIFLDGDGSSQLQAKHVRLPGDGRQVYQMLSVIR